jgi:hypothetical protein
MTLTESTIEQATIEWRKTQGSTYAFDFEINSDTTVSKPASRSDMPSMLKLMRGNVRKREIMEIHL